MSRVTTNSGKGYRHNRRPRPQHQIDLFMSGLSNDASGAPAWSELLAEARAALTSLMMQLILDHATTAALGWSEIEVIDDDLDRSAAGGVQRAGFERMVAELCLGKVGAVCAREPAVAAGHTAEGVSVKIRRKERSEWLTLKSNTQDGYVSWERFEAIRAMVSSNVPTGRHHGAPKHRDALLAGLIRCKLRPQALATQA